MLELRAKCAKAADAPLRFRASEDLAPGLRVALHGSYLILFRIMEAEAAGRIERVVHGSRDLSRLTEGDA